MFVRGLAHGSGVIGAVLVLMFVVGTTIPPADEFPDSIWGAFHTFFVGVLVDQEGLPDHHDPDWLERVEPGDIIVVSRGRVAWGQWSHAAVVVEAPSDARWVEPGSLAVLDASIHAGMYLSPVESYGHWPRVAVLRASHDPEVRARIAAAALEQRGRMFAGVARAGAPYTNCTKAAIDALAAVGLDAGLTGWRMPDELFRSDLWVE